MIHRIQVSLRTWHPSGDPISPADFVSELRAEAQFIAQAGTGQPWQAARLILCDLSFEQFTGKVEPSEAFHAALQELFIKASDWLSLIRDDALVSIRRRGLLTDLFIELWIDQDQVDLDLPGQFVSQLGRLQLPIKMISND